MGGSGFGDTQQSRHTAVRVEVRCQSHSRQVTVEATGQDSNAQRELFKYKRRRQRYEH